MTKPLPKQVWLLGGVSFFADVSSEMIYPLLPLFIVAVLGATATDMGWIEGIAQGTVALMAAWAGMRSDRFRRGCRGCAVGYMPAGASARAMLVVAIVVAARVARPHRRSPRQGLPREPARRADRGRHARRDPRSRLRPRSRDGYRGRVRRRDRLGDPPVVARRLAERQGHAGRDDRSASVPRRVRDRRGDGARCRSR